jgi:hypothetical protein
MREKSFSVASRPNDEIPFLPGREPTLILSISDMYQNIIINLFIYFLPSANCCTDADQLHTELTMTISLKSIQIYILYYTHMYIYSLESSGRASTLSSGSANGII